MDPPDTLLIPPGDAAKTRLLSLPNEILALILVHLSTIAPACLSPSWFMVLRELKVRYVFWCTSPKRTVDRLGWIAATHICSRLRNIAFGTSRLWASVVVAGHPMRWLSDVLQRSAQHNLSVYLPSFDADWHPGQSLKQKKEERTACMAILRQPCHLSRIEHAILTGLSDWLSFAGELLVNPAPQLETLHLGPHVLESPDAKDKIIVLPQELFGGHGPDAAPRLRSLTLAQCDFSWSSLQYFSTLTVLSITRPYLADDEYEVKYAWPSDEGTARPTTRRADTALGTSMDKVVACLRALPLLQELTLKNALPSWDPTVTATIHHDHPPILLPELRHVHITQRSLHPLSYILDLLDAPHLTFCELKYSTIARPAGPDLQTRYSSLTRFLSRFARNLPSLISAVSMDFGTPDVVLCARYAVPATEKSDSEPPSQHSGCDRLCLKITLTMAIVPETPETFPIRHVCVEPILSALPLAHLSELEVSDWIRAVDEESYFAVDFSFWSRIYSLCANARKVKASGLALIPLIPLLTNSNFFPWTFNEPPTLPRTPVFPNLQTLDLSVNKLSEFDRGLAICLADLEPNEYDEGAVTIYKLIDAVRDCLQSRSECLERLGLPKLRRLSMMIALWDIDADTEDVESFKETFREELETVAEEIDTLNVKVEQRVRVHRRVKMENGRTIIYT